MSNFTLALAVLGGLVLAGVVAHGAWNARKGRLRQADVVTGYDAEPQFFKRPLAMHPDLPGSHTDPQMGDELHLNEVEAGDTLQMDEALEQVMSIAHLNEKKPKIDSLIDAIASVSLDHEVSGEAVLAVIPGTRRVGSKPILIEAQPLGSDEWEYPLAGRRYTKLQLGVQMANRTGALTEIEFSEFVVKVQAISDALLGTAEFPDMASEISKAREIDQFAASHDAQLSLHLFSKRVAWSAGFVQQCASRLGFIAGSLPGRMVLPAAVSGNPALIALNFDSQAALNQDLNGTGLRHLTLTLDVPQVDRLENPFAMMRQIADLLAVSMDAVIADEHGKAVSVETLNLIETDLQQLYDRLESRDFHAGSPLARRLFS